MFDLIRKIIEKKETPGTEIPVDNVEKTQIAACVLLLEAAHIDNECTDQEMEHIITTLQNHFSITQETVTELVELAHTHRKNSVDLWEFTNHMNQKYSREEKIAVLEAVWRIIHLDGQLEMHEDHFAHKLANLLRLNHKELIDAKLKARDQLNEG